MERGIRFDFGISNKEVINYLQNLKSELAETQEAFDRVGQTGRRAFGLSGKSTHEYNEELKRTNGLIEDVEDSIKDWEQKARRATNVKDLERYNRKIAEGKLHLKEYGKIGVKSFKDVNKEAAKGTSTYDKLSRKIRNVFSAVLLYRAVGNLKDVALSLDLLGKKANIVFGKYTKDVKNVAKVTSSSLGLTEAEYLKAAAGIGDLLVPMQFQRKEAAALSIGLVELSGALAEWSMGKYDAVEVSHILTKSLLGEREQIKSLGILVRESEINNKLAEKGQNKLTGAALAQAKALATLEIIYYQSQDAQKSFSENSDSLTRKYSEMNAKFKTVRDVISEDLIPTFNTLFGYINRNFGAIKTLAKWLGVALGAFLGYRVGVLVTNNVMKTYSMVTNIATISTKTFDKTMKTSMIGIFASLLTTAVTAMIIFKDSTDKGTESLGDFEDELDNVNKKLGGNIYQNLVYGWDEVTKTFTGSIEKLQAGIKKFTKNELESLKIYLEDTLAHTKQLGDGATDLEKKVNEIHLDNFRKALALINKEIELFGGDDGGGKAIKTYADLKKEIKELEEQLRNEIVANDDNATSTIRLLRQKKELLDVYDDTNAAMQKMISTMKSLTIDNAEQDKSNPFFDTDYLFAKNVDEEEVKKGFLEWLGKVQDTINNTELPDPGEGEFSFWNLIGLDPNNPEDQEMIVLAQEYANQMINIIGSVIDAEKQAADERLSLANTRIAEKQREIEAEIQLNAAGYASNIALKQQELAILKAEREKSLKDQEEAKKKQIILDSIVQASGLITSSANIFKQFSKIPYIGIPLAIAMIGTMMGAFVASKSKAIKLTKLRKGRTGMIKGRSHEEGGEHYEVEDGEYSSITPKDKAKKHLPLLEAIRTDDKIGMTKALVRLLEGTGIVLSKGLPDRLREQQLNHRISLDDQYVRENNMLLNKYLSGNNIPSIDNSDPRYTKLIYPDGNEKWINQ